MGSCSCVHCVCAYSLSLQCVHSQTQIALLSMIYAYLCGHSPIHLTSLCCHSEYSFGEEIAEMLDAISLLNANTKEVEDDMESAR